MPPNAVLVKTTGLPTVNWVVLVHVIKLVVLSVITELVCTWFNVILTVGGLAYPLIKPLLLISNPGGNVPSCSSMTTWLVLLGFEYIIGNSIHTLSNVFKILPTGVVNFGIAEPEIDIENVLSVILRKLSVALIVKVLVISLVTSTGVPLINPLELIDIPLGNVPLNNV